MRYLNPWRTVAVLGVISAGVAAVELPFMPGALASQAGSAVAMQSAAAMRPASAPATPFLVSVDAQGLGLLVSWLPDPGTEQVTSYKVKASAAVGGQTPPPGCAGPFTVPVSAANSAAVVPGLCARVAYQATVAAVSGGGTSPASPASSPVVPLPAQVPQAPLITSVFGRPEALIVSWTAPGDDGGKPVTEYTLTATAKGKTTRTLVQKASATTATIKGLADGTKYSVTLTAANAVGKSAAATATGTPGRAHAPAGPAQVSARPDGTGTVTVSWTAPADNGGDALTGFVITWQQVVPAAKGTGYVPAPGSKPRRTTTGPSGTAVALAKSRFSPAAALYSITVAAMNAAGTGIAVPLANPVSPVTSVKSGTVVLSVATMSAMASDTPAPSGNGNVLFWPNPVPAQVPALTDGQVIVARPAHAAPTGLLDVVANVSSGSSGTTITTTPAALGDVFNSLAVASTSNPLAPAPNGSAFRGMAGRFIPAGAGIRDLVPQGPTLSFSQTLRLSFNYSAGDKTLGVDVKGELDLTPSLSLDLNLDQGYAGIPDGVKVSASASLAASTRISVEAHVRYAKQLGEIDGAPITIPIAGVPLVIVPKIPITLSVNGQLGVLVTATVTVGGGLSWDSHDPTKLDTTSSNIPFKVTAGPLPGKTTNGQIVADLSTQPQLDIYDLGGPNIQADAILTADVNFTPPPGGAFLTLTPSLKLSVGLTVTAFGFNDSFELPLLTLKFPAFKILKPPGGELVITPDSPQVQPGDTVQFTAARTDGKPGIPITWSLDGAAGDTISQTGKFKAAAPTERAVTVQATDKTGAIGQTVVVIGAPFDSVGNLRAAQDYNQLAAKVTWTAPGNTGGSAITDYLVTGSNSLPTQKTTSTSVTLTNLRPGISYTITVYPANASGFTGPPASATLRVIPLCTDTFTAGSNPARWTTPGNWSRGAIPTVADWVCTSPSASGGSQIMMPARAVTVQGLELPPGTLTIPAGGNLTATSAFIDDGVLAGPGKLTVPATGSAILGTFRLTNGVRLVNKGSMEIRTSCNCFSSQEFAGASVLDNTGTLTLDDGVNLTQADNTGDEVVNEAGGTISFSGSTPNATTAIGVPLANGGTVDVEQGTLAITTDGTGSGTPAMTGAGVITLAGTSALAPGTTMSGLAELDVPQSSTLNVPVPISLGADHVVLAGKVSGPGSATIPARSSATLAGTFTFANGIHLVNKGSTEIQTSCNCFSSQEFTGASVLDNAGTLTLDDGVNLAQADGTADKVINEASGTISYAASTSTKTTTIGVPLSNSGTIRSDQGTLIITPDGGGSGTPVMTGAGVITLAGTSTLAIGTTMTGLAELDVPSAATLDVPAPLALGVRHIILAGKLSGPGTATVPAASTATLAGTFIFTGGAHLVNKGRTEIQKSCNCFSAQEFSGNSVLDNAGTLTLDDGVNLIQADGTADKVINEAAGTITYDGTTAAATTTIGVPVTDNGTIEIARGTLKVGSSLTLSAKTLAIGIAGQKDFGHLSVTGTLTLGGILAIKTARGYLPAIGTTIKIITATNRSGTFAKITGTQLSGRKWSVSYTPTTVTLKTVTG